MLIVGCGNRDRGDDAAGLLVIEKLRALGVDCIGATLTTCSGDVTELIQRWGPDDEVIIVDAVFTGAPVGTVHIWEADFPAAGYSPATSTHGFGIHEALRLARVIDHVPKVVRIYGIEARQFEPGDRLSSEVERGIVNVTQKIKAEILVTESAMPAQR